MPSSAKPKPRFAAALLIAVLAVAVICIGYAVLHSGPWIVPEEAKKVKNPLAPSEAELAVARSIYLEKCSDCHGESGRGDGPQAKMYDTQPADLTDNSQLNKVTDGELFYKITHGHKPMPAFKKRLSDTQRWQLVLLIRAISHSTSPVFPASK
ncbi:MAG TPA: cytochrome c [Candidatus Acidoferrum sp.]|nr:cytochrome c [Candidatus Acidoferrum sp.]